MIRDWLRNLYHSYLCDWVIAEDEPFETPHPAGADLSLPTVTEMRPWRYTRYFREDIKPARFRLDWSRLAILLGVIALGAWIVSLLLRNPIIAVEDWKLKPGPHELDLSGAWKYQLDDSESFKDPGLDDSGWCQIHAPQPGWLGKEPLKQPPGCVSAPDAFSRMRNRTYWYRKEVVIPPGFSLQQPSLFLGAVKSSGFVYWDGRFIGSVLKETNPAILMLKQEWIVPGRHLVSVQVTAGNDRFPGLIHANPRGLTLGELNGSKTGFNFRIRADYVEPLLIIVLQGLSLLVVVLAILKRLTTYQQLLPFLAFIAGSTINAILYFGTTETPHLIALNGICTSLSAFGLLGIAIQEYLKDNPRHTYPWRTIQAGIAIPILVQAASVLLQRYTFAARLETTVNALCGIGALTLVCVVFSGLRVRDKRKATGSSAAALAFLLVAYFIRLAPQLLVGRLPVFYHAPLMSAVLTMFGVLLVLRSYVLMVKKLAFLDRFSQPGLKALLNDVTKRNAPVGSFIVRGNRTVLIKVDIVGFTDFIDSMPYGLFVIFQNLLYRTFDTAFRKHALTRGPEGDAISYYLDPGANPDLCSFSLGLIEQVEAQSLLKRLGFEFQRMTLQRLREEPRLRAPFRAYQNKLRRKLHAEASSRGDHPKGFWDWDFQFRAVMVYGYVDEGLWGYVADSYYGHAGQLLVLLGRLEKLAGAGEIVVNPEFLTALEHESNAGISLKDYAVHRKTATLKGLGERPLAVLRKVDTEERQAA